MMSSADLGGLAQSPERVLYFVLLQLVAIIASARALGWLARKVGQPRSVGEIIAGVLLGPSLFGRLDPGLFHYVFASITPLPLVVMSQIGLTLLMFQVGMGFDFSHLKEAANGWAAAATAAGSIVPPFVLGVVLGFVSQPYLAAGVPVIPYSLFIGTAFAITAVPVLGRILVEYGLARTRIGAIAISAAAVNDVIGWLLLLAVAAFARARFSAATMALHLAFLGLYLVGAFVVVKPFVRRVLARLSWPEGPGLAPDVLALTLLAVFVSGIMTYEIGIFTIFGGFVMGVIVNTHTEFVRRFQQTVGDFIFVFFLPVFFTYAGLRADLTGINTSTLWLWCVAIVFVATLAKGAGAYVGARIGGLDGMSAAVMGALMNTRGLMELIVINIGYSAGFIPHIVYTLLVVMAIVTTMATGPALRVSLPRLGHVIPEDMDA
ncbi:cation:proton antiporter [Acidiferrobacter sp.]|uniref:cation:proton antiporter n=1 Tax=Acidiferrobacter sp. TaxID=1872107 RepID=UPI0026353595|nr:cation:proton antiporter [Acidiferrobacter sp.]